jgi:hypothetical protein
MRKRSARAIDAVAFHQIVQDAPVRLNSLRFGMICQAAVISIIGNPKFKGLARVSLVTGVPPENLIRDDARVGVW